MVIVHLHDEDLLGRLSVKVGQAAFRIEARFDPLNVSAARGTRVDFTDGKAVERGDTFARTFEEYLKRREEQAHGAGPKRQGRGGRRCRCS